MWWIPVYFELQKLQLLLIPKVFGLVRIHFKEKKERKNNKDA